MHTKILATVALLALAVSSQALAQQTPGQDDQPDAEPVHQTTSASWTTSGTPPEQAGDLYQSRTRSNDNTSDGTTPGDTLPGALNPGPEALDSGKQPDPKE